MLHKLKRILLETMPNKVFCINCDNLSTEKNCLFMEKYVIMHA